MVPTSRRAALKVCSLVKSGRRKVVIEYGPGTGAVSKALLEPGILTSDSLVILIEKTKEFADMLKQELSADIRVKVFHDSAINARKILKFCGEEQADNVLCSVPLSLLDPTERKKILFETRDVLKSEGSLIVYLFRYRIGTYLREFFNNVRMQLELFNIPPLFIFEAKNDKPHR